MPSCRGATGARGGARQGEGPWAADQLPRMTWAPCPCPVTGPPSGLRHPTACLSRRSSGLRLPVRPARRKRSEYAARTVAEFEAASSQKTRHGRGHHRGTHRRCRRRRAGASGGILRATAGRSATASTSCSSSTRSSQGWVGPATGLPAPVREWCRTFCGREGPQRRLFARGAVLLREHLVETIREGRASRRLATLSPGTPSVPPRAWPC